MNQDDTNAEQTSKKIRELTKQRDELLAVLEELLVMIDEPPERNCSCHIAPPCNDCVEYSGMRYALYQARAAIASVKGGTA